jgi:hypothetical protein
LVGGTKASDQKSIERVDVLCAICEPHLLSLTDGRHTDAT